MFHDCRFSPRTRCGYTQNIEEEYILKHATGNRFLDIGAYDGETFSSTKALVEKGWTGVYVEPNPLILPRLNAYAKQHQCEVLEVAVGEVCDVLPFYLNADMVSSLDKKHTDAWAKNNQMVFETAMVKVVDIPRLAEMVGTEFDMLNLDIEGLNYQIFNQFDWSQWKFKVVCIEYDRHFIEIKHSLEKAGFKVVYSSPENIVAVRE